MKASILKQTAMACTQNKPIPIKPRGLPGVAPEHVPVQEIAHFGHAQRHSRVPCFRRLHRIDDQHPQIVDAAPVHDFLEFLIGIPIDGGGFRGIRFLELVFPGELVVVIGGGRIGGLEEADTP